jgi:hypothetical protein
LPVAPLLCGVIAAVPGFSTFPTYKSRRPSVTLAAARLGQG